MQSCNATTDCPAEFGCSQCTNSYEGSLSAVSRVSCSNTCSFKVLQLWCFPEIMHEIMHFSSCFPYPQDTTTHTCPQIYLTVLLGS